ncbi:MAG TPA: zf-HC2 domain-containing protein [Thermoanaerobaculia bacterium]|nr:zf-HC2 domain-containing protein [Thermoanaerobaculia bacterium]
MITCEQLIGTLDDYVAEELPERDREDVDRHLALCDSCVAYTASYRRTIELEKSLASGDLKARIPEELARRIASKRRE